MSLSEDEQHRVGEIESLTAAADPRFARRLDLSTAAATAAASGRCGGVARTHQRRWYRLRRRPVSVAGRRARQHPLSKFSYYTYCVWRSITRPAVTGSPTMTSS